MSPPEDGLRRAASLVPGERVRVQAIKLELAETGGVEGTLWEQKGGGHVFVLTLGDSSRMNEGTSPGCL